MPGLVAFRRRWSIGSDDLALPGAIFLLLHTAWLTVLVWVLVRVELDASVVCQHRLRQYILGYVSIVSCCVLLEAGLVGVSMRGTILDTAPRRPAQYLVYVRLGLMLLEMVWLVLGVLWLVEHYHTCNARAASRVMIGVLVCNWVSVAAALITAWCTFDPAGRSWVKMKRYQRTMKDGQSKYQYKRSGSHHRNWRHRKVLRAYRDSWDHRCRLLFCCMARSDRHQSSFSDIAQLLSEFFRDLDVVPSDILAGVVLLRRLQKTRRSNIVRSASNDTYEFLSGVRVTPQSRFLALNRPDELALLQDAGYFMRFAMSIYGWPIFMMQHSVTGCCRLCPHFRCCCRGPRQLDAVEDNGCGCNAAATQRMMPADGVDVIHVTYHVDVGETPFLVAVDHGRRAVLLVIRGTMSTKDVVTDLECEGEPIPTRPPRDDWLGHKGMVQAAQYIRQQLQQQQLLERAFNSCPERGTASYQLVLAGHSLGAGTAAILAILLREAHPTLRCFAFSPPGGLLSMPAVEYSKEFITSVVVGKDVVPRIGLHQLEQLRSDLMHVIKHSRQSKWRTITAGLACCGGGALAESVSPAVQGPYDDPELSPVYARHLMTTHPSDSSIALTVHQPLYPPGRLIHVVRHHQHTHGKRRVRSEPVYQAIWVENDSFDEVLISPVMIQDHMPDKVLHALQQILARRAARQHSFPGCVLPRVSAASPAAPSADSDVAPDMQNRCVFTVSTDVIPGNHDVIPSNHYAMHSNRDVVSSSHDTMPSNHDLSIPSSRIATPNRRKATAKVKSMSKSGDITLEYDDFKRGDAGDVIVGDNVATHGTSGAPSVTVGVQSGGHHLMVIRLPMEANPDEAVEIDTEYI